MKLTHRYDCYLELNEYLSHEYHCELTKELDDLAGFDKKMIDEYEYGHYILGTEADMKQRLLYIRIPDGTVVKDFGDSVYLKYKSGGYIEQTVLKDCYFNTKGRYIKVKGKRVYI